MPPSTITHLNVLFHLTNSHLSGLRVMNSFYSTEDNGKVHNHRKSEQSKWRGQNFFHLKNILYRYNILNLIIYMYLLYPPTFHRKSNLYIFIWCNLLYSSCNFILNTQPFKLTSHQYLDVVTVPYIILPMTQICVGLKDKY